MGIITIIQFPHPQLSIRTPTDIQGHIRRKLPQHGVRPEAPKYDNSAHCYWRKELSMENYHLKGITVFIRRTPDYPGALSSYSYIPAPALVNPGVSGLTPALRIKVSGTHKPISGPHLLSGFWNYHLRPLIRVSGLSDPPTGFLEQLLYRSKLQRVSPPLNQSIILKTTTGSLHTQTPKSVILPLGMSGDPSMSTSPPPVLNPRWNSPPA